MCVCVCAVVRTIGDEEATEALSQKLPLLVLKLVDPMIQIPRSSTSTDLVVAHFREFSISNKTEELANLVVSLDDLAVYSTLGDVSHTLLGSSSVTISLALRDHIGISVFVPFIPLICNQAQMELMMALASENLGEKTDLTVVKTPVLMPARPTVKSTSTGENRAKLNKAVKRAATAETFTPIRFNLTFKGASLSLLYRNDGFSPETDRIDISSADGKLGKISCIDHHDQSFAPI